MTKFTRWLVVAVATQSFPINVTKVARNATVDQKWFVKPSAQ